MVLKKICGTNNIVKYPTIAPIANITYIWYLLVMHGTAHTKKFSIKDFFSKCDQIRRKLQIWSHLLKKSLTENFMFCAVWPERGGNVVRQIKLELMKEVH